jgi:hypothetical protein
LQSPIVGDATGATFDDNFVFPDAWNLDLLVSDVETSDAGIRWSYTIGEVTGLAGVPASIYILNGVEPQVDPSLAEAIEPSAAFRIDTQDLDPDQVDDNTRTVTIRDRILSPIAGPNVDPPGSGIVAQEIVTLFASDGTSLTWATTIIYTDDGGEDRYSGAVLETLEVIDGSTAAMPGDFVYSDFDGTSPPETTGGTTFAQNANGLCITVAAAGDNIGSLDSPDQRFEIADLSVYRVRLGMSTTSVADFTPLISMTYNSANNEFGGELIVLDNVGSANAPFNGSNGRTEFQFWIGPPGLEVAAWRSVVDGAFAPASIARKFKLVLRLLDVASVVGGIDNVGTVCWNSIELSRADLASLIAGETNVFTGNLVAATGTTGFELNNLGGIDQWTVAFNAGAATVTADTTPTVGVAFAAFRPGNGDGTAGNPAGIPDDYPVAWDTPDQLLHVTHTIASDATGAADPPEVLRSGGDTPTQEIISNHFWSILGIGEKAMPTTTATTFHSFFYTHSVTAAVFGNAGTIRPLLEFFDRNAGGEFGTDGSTTASGAWTISSVTVGDVSANNQ